MTKKKTLQNPLRRALSLLLLLVFLCVQVFPAAASESSDPLQVDVTASVTGESAQMMNSILNDSSLTFKAQEAGDSYLLNLDAVFSGVNVLQLLVEATPEKVAFSLPGIDETRYECSVEKLAMLLGQSAGLQSAVPAMPSIPAAPSDPAAPTEPSVPAAPAEENVTITEEEIFEVLDPYIAYLSDTISTGMQEKDGVVELSHLGIIKEGTIHTYEPTAQELAKIFNDLADMLEQDKSAENFVDKLATMIENQNDISAALISVTTASGESMTPQETAAALREGFASLPAALRDAAASLEKDGLGDEYIRIERLDINGYWCKYHFQIGTPEAVTMDAGIEMDPDSDPENTVCVYLEEAEQNYSITFDKQTTEDALETQIVTVKVDSVPVAILTYTTDPSGEDSLPFKTASLNILGVDLTLSAREEADGTFTLIISLRGIESPTDPTGISGVDLNIHAGPADGVEAPSGTVKDISEYSEEEMSALFEELGEKLGQKFETLFG